jgi:hypothetical protein
MGAAMRKRPLRSPGLSEEEYWRWLGACAFKQNIDIEEYEGPISAQQRDWFYAGKREEMILKDIEDDDDWGPSIQGETPTHVIVDEIGVPEKEEPKLKVVPLQESNYRDISTTLRLIADQIDSGEYGNVNDCALVLQGATLDIFHMGAGNVETAHLLFACAQRKLELAVIEHYE